MSGDRLSVDLQRLNQSDLPALRRRWRATFGKAPPITLPRWLLQRALMHRIQADALGDLDRATARSIDRLAGEGTAIPLPGLRPIKPGTLLVREWEGEMQRVMVLDEGFAWNGGSYASLSAVALAITGTRWNGPRFFGLRQGSQDPGTRP